MLNSMYDVIDVDHENLIKQNSEFLIDMLDFAIDELASISEDSEIYLVDDGKICADYESIFDCLKHWAIKRSYIK